MIMLFKVVHTLPDAIDPSLHFGAVKA